MKRIALAASVAVLACLAVPASASAIAYAIVDTPPRLVSFDPAAPGTLLSSATVTGLDANETVLGFDLRPATGDVVVVTDTAGVGRIRTIDPGTAAVAAPLALIADPTDATNPFTAFSGTSFGVDFNPVPDRLRVVSDADQNLRINPNTGATITDSNVNPGNPNVVASGYTNSFGGAMATTLYGVDSSTDMLVLQNPPNDGTLSNVGAGLGVNIAAGAGFDVATNGNAAYLGAAVGGVSGLYTVNLTTGAATLIGNIGDGSDATRGLIIAENVFRFASASVDEGEGGTIELTVERLTPHLGATVDYATADGTAVAGSDYEAKSGTLTFTAGEATKTITIPLPDDSADEESKTFTVALSNEDPDNTATATIAGPSATATVTDNDPAAGAPPDRDGDGVPDASDTCPNIADPGQGDADGDGIGTACDLTEASALPDTVRPILLATAAETRRSRLRRRGVRVRFSCSEACTVAGRLLAGRRVVARGSGRVTAAALGSLRLRPNRTGLRRIGRRKVLRVRLTARDAAGNASSFAFSVRIL